MHKLLRTRRYAAEHVLLHEFDSLVTESGKSKLEMAVPLNILPAYT
jgi:hypothetical protein